MAATHLVMNYLHWLHTRWPAGTVEKLPVAGPEGQTNLPGVRIAGDLTGIPLLKFAADSGARAVQSLAAELKREAQRAAPVPVLAGGASGAGTVAEPETPLDLAIIGAGVAGIAAALEARQAGLRFAVYEAVQPFSTIANFPKAKPIYTYPSEMVPRGQMRFGASVKEELLAELEQQRTAAGIEPVALRVERIERHGDWLHLVAGSRVIRARRVIIAIGRSGNYRKLGVPGEQLDKVSNRLYDPLEYRGRQVLVVGGGDSALESAIALSVAGAHVTLSYRGREFSRPKPENIAKLELLQRDPAARTGVEQPRSERVNTAFAADNAPAPANGSLQVRLGSQVQEIRPASVIIDGQEQHNDAVLVMIGREAPLEFFRRSGLAIRGEWTAKTWAGLVGFFLFCVLVYTWKSGGAVTRFFREQGWFPFGFTSATLAEPGFYYSLAYCVCVVLFGFGRMRRRPTPYVRVQTLTLMAVQVVPLFLLPYLILPAMGAAGWFDAGWGKTIADNLFPAVNYGHGREYWRAFGLILAWPLFIWNFFTAQPLWWWLAIGLVQTFVVIPLIVWRWGKGAYCGWICSCGALAETLGDQHRQKMPHGPRWNRLNMTGQVILATALVLFGLRVFTWTWPGTALDGLFNLGLGVYYQLVDIFLAGMVGVGLYFWFSGRVWCRFACPLAALMHIYARFSRFRIFPDKSKCISCNVCTSVCHQGIDIMNFANKGLPMEDPQCVRCSACVQECPTGVLAFGRYGAKREVILDKLSASNVRQQERQP